MSTNEGNLLNPTRFSRLNNSRGAYVSSSKSPVLTERKPSGRTHWSRERHSSFDDDEDSEKHSGPRTPSTLEESFSAMNIGAADGEEYHETFNFADIGEGKRLVIAIDYGTTFTGVAFAFVPVDQKTAKLDDINLIYQWNKMSIGDKVPSVYSYTLPKAGEDQWGNSLSDDAVTMVHSKLELDAQQTRLDELEIIVHNLIGMHDLHFDQVMKTDGKPDFTYKKAEIIVLDYMSQVFDHVMKYLRDKVTAELLRSLPVDIVITHPVVWSYKAKNATYRAVTLAGFNKVTFPKLQNIMMIAEPEAAAVYTARYLKEKDPDKTILKKNSTFVLCDAGGGTVDVVTFRVIQMEPLELQQVGAPHSAKCGSVFIDGKFKHWLRDDVLGPEDYEHLEPNTKKRIDPRCTTGLKMREFMDEFINKKRAFSGEDDPNDPDRKIELPTEFGELTTGDRVNKGQLYLDNGLMKWLFEDCVDEIVELVKVQAAQVDEYEEEGVARVKAILMIGGFGESVYLQSAIRRNLMARRIAVHQPETSWSAVVRGACLYGIEKTRLQHYVNTASYPYFYGVAQDMEETKDAEKSQYLDEITGKTMGKKRLSWIVHRGDLALSDYLESKETLLAFNFLEHGDRNFTICVYKYLEDDDFLPFRVKEKDSELEQVLSIPVNLTDVKLDQCELYESVGGRQPYYQCVVSLYLTWNNESIAATVVWNNRVIYPIQLSR